MERYKCGMESNVNILQIDNKIIMEFQATICTKSNKFDRTNVGGACLATTVMSNKINNLRN